MKKILCASSLLLLLTGYGLKPSVPSVRAQTPSQIPQQLPSDSAKPPATTKPQLELLNPGAEPRKELRFQPPADAKQTATMTFKMNLTGAMAGNPMPSINLPTMTMMMETLVNKIDGNGDIHYQFSYTDADAVGDATVPPQAIDAMRSYLKKLVGISGTAIVDNRGYTKTGNFALPEGSDETFNQVMTQMTSSIEQLSSPVPQEAVGIGAKWRVSYALNANGVNMTQFATYELVSFQDNIATLNVNLEQRADSQTMNLPGMPAGTKVNLKSLNSQGMGQVKMRLDRLIPLASNITMRSNMEVNAQNPSTMEDIAMNWNYLMEMSLDSK